MKKYYSFYRAKNKREDEIKERKKQWKVERKERYRGISRYPLTMTIRDVAITGCGGVRTPRLLETFVFSQQKICIFL